MFTFRGNDMDIVELCRPTPTLACTILAQPLAKLS